MQRSVVELLFLMQQACLSFACLGLMSMTAWADQQPRLRATLPHEASEKGGHYRVWSVAFSPDGKALASCSGKTINLWDLADGKNIATLKEQPDLVAYSAFSPDGKTLASSGAFKRGGVIKLWDITSGKDKTIFQDSDHLIGSVLFSPDGKTLVWAMEHATIKIWDVAAGKIKTTLKGDTLKGEGFLISIAISPDGKTLAAGGGFPKSGGGVINLWDMAGGKKRSFQKEDTPLVWSVAFSPDGKTLASANGAATDPGEIKFWEVATGETTGFAPKGSAGFVKCVAFTPDGKTLASLDAKEGIKLWEVASGKVRANLKEENDKASSMAVSRDGRFLAAGLWGEIQLWELPAIKKAR